MTTDINIESALSLAFNISDIVCSRAIMRHAPQNFWVKLRWKLPGHVTDGNRLGDKLGFVDGVLLVFTMGRIDSFAFITPV